MIFFLGMVAFLAAVFLSFNLRREFAFHGTKESIALATGARCLVESKFAEHISKYRVTIGITIGKRLELRIEREGWVSRWLASVGIGRDVKTFNTMLDRELIFESDDPRVAAWLAADKRTHAIFRAIFALKPARLIAHQGRIWLCFQGSTSDDTVAGNNGTALLADVAALLTQLDQCIPETLVGECAVSVAKKAKAMLLLAMSSGFAALAVLLGVVQLKSTFPALAQPWRFYGGAMCVAILTGLILLWAAARWISNSARARIVLLELATIGLCGFVLTTNLLLARGNLAFAKTPVMTEVVKLESAYQETTGFGRNRRNKYYIQLANLAEGSVRPAALRVDSAQFFDLQRAKQVRVRSQIGYFGQLVVLSSPVPVAE
jgi:hypothetical protein